MNVGELYNPWKMFTGVFIPDAIVRLTEISPGAKLLFGRLCWHAGKDGKCFPDQATLAEETGISNRSVRNYLDELEQGGFIAKSREGLSGSHPYSYMFVWHECLEVSLKKKDESAKFAYSAESAKSANSIRQSLPVESAKSAECINKEVLREAVREKVEENSTGGAPQPSPEINVDKLEVSFQDLFTSATMGHKAYIRGRAEREAVTLLEEHFVENAEDLKQLIVSDQETYSDHSGGLCARRIADQLRLTTGKTPSRVRFKSSAVAIPRGRHSISKPFGRGNILPGQDTGLESRLFDKFRDEWNWVMVEFAKASEDMKPTRDIVAICENPEFQEKFPGILERCRLLHEQADGDWAPTFDWLFRQKPGEEPGWRKVPRLKIFKNGNHAAVDEWTQAATDLGAGT